MDPIGARDIVNMEDQTEFFLAFRNSNSLRFKTESLITAIRNQEEAPQAYLLVEILNEFIEQLLNAYFVASTKGLNLHPAADKILDFTINTISTSASILIKRALGQIPNESLPELADYMENLMYVTQEEGNSEVCYTVIPANEHLIEALGGITADESKELGLMQLQPALYEILNTALLHYYHQPIELLQLSMLKKKIADMGYGTARKATELMIERILPLLSLDQIAALHIYFRGMLLVKTPEFETLPN